MLACATKGGVIGITAVPNRLSNDPEQSIECVLDHYVYLVKLVGVGHVAIGTDTCTGDMVEISRVSLGRTGARSGVLSERPGLARRQQGHHKGPLARSYSDGDIGRIAGGNVRAFFRRITG